MAYEHILVPIDGSETSFAAVQQAADIAKNFRSKITVLQVLAIDPYIEAQYITAVRSNDIIDRAKQNIQETLDKAKQLFRDQGLVVDTKIAEGQVIHHEIVQAAEEVGADLIVIGSHGRTGFKKFILGSVAQNVLGEVKIPVLVVRKE
ncbi:universal stress protein [Acinetobacter stercoris]|uniref:Universal stress protein n=1 Tax=Acinetobacter stercoris TaxID=2126983 RepID=A0A2U3N0W2_9GAMM|nr:MULTISPECIES: universal stress protein [Acinetobacter]SPL71273.1 putative universal stress protein [Acinetobacter stercoris]